MENNMIRAVSKSGGAVICAIDSTDIVREMERIHHTSAVASAALGRLLTAASLMGSWLKSPHNSITLRVDGGGPLGVLVAVTNGTANVRGYCAHPRVELPPNAVGKLDVGGAVGQSGTLSVVKDLGLKEPYVGQTPLVSGEIAEDITRYYASSEQTPTVCALGVLVAPDLSIRKAGGYLLQLLPGTSDKEISQIESNIRSIPAVTTFLEEGGTPTDMAQRALAGLSCEILETRTTQYQCQCSREKTQDILASLGKSELEAMQKEEATAEVVCHFCGNKYIFDLEDLMKNFEEK